MTVEKRPIRTGVVLCCGLWCAGCVQPEAPKTMNITDEEVGMHRSELQQYFAYHNDQGMMADLSLSDIHFVPHSVHLSGTGEARLNRYAELLAEEGGTLSYQTSQCDEELTEARLAIARSYLAKACPTGSQIDVVLGLPGGRGMSATEAAAGQAVAKQPEPRGSAYKLAGSIESGSSNGG